MREIDKVTSIPRGCGRGAGKEQGRDERGRGREEEGERREGEGRGGMVMVGISVYKSGDGDMSFQYYGKFLGENTEKPKKILHVRIRKKIAFEEINVTSN